jgi:hypothetical protein
MTDEEIQAALASRPRPAAPPMKTRPVSEILAVTDEHALTMARKFGLLDDQGYLHCGHCKAVCDWHVSLHCPACRASAPARQRDREQQERERIATQRRDQEQSRPVQKVSGRGFRDGY